MIYIFSCSCICNSANLLPAWTLPLYLSLFQYHRGYHWHLLRPIKVHELQDIDGVGNVIVGLGSLHATVVLVATVAAFTTPYRCLWVPVPHDAFTPLTTLIGVVGNRAGLCAVSLFLAEVNAVKDVGRGAGFSLQWPGETPVPSEAAGSPVPEVAAPRLVLAVKILQGLFVGIDGFQRAKELCWKSLEGLQWLHRIEIVAPGAGAVAIQEFLAYV